MGRITRGRVPVSLGCVVISGLFSCHFVKGTQNTQRGIRGDVLVDRSCRTRFLTYQHNKLCIAIAQGHLSAWNGDFHSPRRAHMTNPTTDPAAYTDEELKQALARVIALARSEVLNDAEVERFWQLYEEILRRRASSGTAA